MRALNTQNQMPFQQPHQEFLLKKLTELQALNREKQSIIQKYEEEIKSLQQENLALDEELEQQENQWKDIEGQLEEESSHHFHEDHQSEEEREMNSWIQNVQKYTGLPQEVIDSLCCIEFQGEQEICLSCYQQLAQGVMCTYLPCAHLFHRECINNHLKVNRHCPACQEPVNP